MKFTGLLLQLDTPSTVPPSGARRHKIIIVSHGIEKYINTLIGVKLNFTPCFTKHANNSLKIECSEELPDIYYLGRVTEIKLENNNLWVYGYIQEDKISFLQALSKEELDSLGMSFELSKAHIYNINADLWTITEGIFCGIAVVKKAKAAYKNSSFQLLQEEGDSYERRL
jgi:hypothetical protein